MAYTTIPTLSDGDILGASHLNAISANQEFLHGVSQQANITFLGVRAVVEDFGASNGMWSIRHRLPYLHYRILAESGNSPTVVRVYYGGYRVVERNDVAFSYTGYATLDDPANWPGYQGAWVTSTGYSDSDAGGDIVEHGGEFYHCIDDHTSGATTEPGVGVDWETVWQLIAFTVGEFYRTYVELSFDDPGNQVTVEYLFEASSTTL